MSYTLAYLTGSGHLEQNEENRITLVNCMAEMFRHGGGVHAADLAHMDAWEQAVCKEAYQLVKTEERLAILTDVVKLLQTK